MRSLLFASLLLSLPAAAQDRPDGGTRRYGDGDSSPIPLDPMDPVGFHTQVQLDYLVQRRGLENLMERGTIFQYHLYDDPDCSNLVWTGYDEITDPQVVVHALDRILPAGSLTNGVAEIRTIREVITGRPLRGAFLRITGDGIFPEVADCQPQRLSRPPDAPVPQGWVLTDSWPSVTYASAYSYAPFERVTLGSTDEMMCALNMVDQADNAYLFGGAEGQPRCEVSKSGGDWELTASLGSEDPDVYDTGSWSVCSAVCWEIANPQDLYPWWQL